LKSLIRKFIQKEWIYFLPHEHKRFKKEKNHTCPRHEELRYIFYNLHNEEVH
jgi:hypothetical protein